MATACDDVCVVIEWLERNLSLGDDAAMIELAVALQGGGDGEAAGGREEEEEVKRLLKYLAAGPNVFSRAVNKMPRATVVAVLFGALGNLEESLVPPSLSEMILEHCSSRNPDHASDVACVDKLKRLLVGFPEEYSVAFKRLMVVLSKIHGACGGASSMAASFAPALFGDLGTIAKSFKAISVVQLAILYADRLSHSEDKYEEVSSTIAAKARVKRAMSRDSPQTSDPHEIAAVHRRWGSLLQESEDVFLSPGVDESPGAYGTVTPLRPNSEVIVATLRERLESEKERREELEKENKRLTSTGSVMEQTLKEKNETIETISKQVEDMKALVAAKDELLEEAKTSSEQAAERAAKDLAERDDIIEALEKDAANTIRDASELLVKTQQSFSSLKKRQAYCAAQFASLGAYDAENRRLRAQLDESSSSVRCDLQSAAWALEEQLNRNEQLRKERDALREYIAKLQVNNTYLNLQANGSW